jgi:hypothetical protein
MKCPFCQTESSRGREKFLIFMDDDRHYRGHHCFVCRSSGSGAFGLKKILDFLGQRLPLYEIESLCAFAVETRRAPVEAIETNTLTWPPDWIKNDPKIQDEAVAYLEERGIIEPRQLLEQYQCVVSRVVLTKRHTIMDYPCIIWPMHDQSGHVIGWSSRAIGEPREGLPKSMGMADPSWKTRSLFGQPQVDVRLPVTVVEGFVSSLATPNSVATCGKAISDQQLKMIAGIGAKTIILALDPDVKAGDVRTLYNSLSLLAADADVLMVPWEKIDRASDDYGPKGGDPADRGASVMAKIIRKLARREDF